MINKQKMDTDKEKRLATIRNNIVLNKIVLLVILPSSW